MASTSNFKLTYSEKAVTADGALSNTNTTGASSGGGGTGTLTQVNTAGSVNGITLTGGPITTTGTVTLGGTLSGIANSQLTNSSVTISAGTGLSGGGTVALGGTTTLTNNGVTNLTAGTGISVSASTGNVTVTNTVSGLPTSASTSQSLLYGTSSAGWYTEHYNVKAFGATGNGSTDDSTAINNAIAALNIAGAGVLYFPAGTYKMISSPTSITASCRILGDGVKASTITQTGGSSNVLTINTNLQCIVQDITLNATSTTGSALYISAPAGYFNSSSIINNVNVAGTVAYGFNLNEAFGIITNCTISGTTGIQIQNSYNPDESAGMISQCTINTNGGTGIALYADGVQVMGNYFYDNNIAIEIFVNNTTGTLSDYWINNNHIEYSITSAIRFTNTSSSAYLANVIITGNEIAWSHTGSATCNGIDQSSTFAAPWLIDFTIGDNVFNTNVYSIYLTNAQDGTIVGNTITPSTTGIALGTYTSNIVTKANQISSVTYPYTDSGSNNLTDYWVGKGVNVTQQNSGGTGFSVPNASETNISWNRTIYNDGSFWSSSNPDRITIPYNVGIKRVQLTACINWDPNATGNRQIKIKDNNGNTYGGNLIAGGNASNFASDYNSTLSCMIDLASMSNPTYFFVTGTQDSGGSLNVRSSYGSFFCLEIKG